VRRTLPPRGGSRNTRGRNAAQAQTDPEKVQKAAQGPFLPRVSIAGLLNVAARRATALRHTQTPRCQGIFPRPDWRTACGIDAGGGQPDECAYRSTRRIQSQKLVIPVRYVARGQVLQTHVHRAEPEAVHVDRCGLQSRPVRGCSSISPIPPNRRALRRRQLGHRRGELRIWAGSAKTRKDRMAVLLRGSEIPATVCSDSIRSGGDLAPRGRLVFSARITNISQSGGFMRLGVAAPLGTVADST